MLPLEYERTEVVEEQKVLGAPGAPERDAPALQAQALRALNAERWRNMTNVKALWKSKKRSRRENVHVGVSLSDRATGQNSEEGGIK